MSYTQLYTNPAMLLSGEGEPAATILGVPFDSTHSYRPGCRFGPDYIRGLFNNIEVFHPEMGVDLEQSSLRDLGNIVQTVDAAEMIGMVRKVASEMRLNGTISVVLGGEHLITLGSYMAFPPGTGLVVLDAHYDLRDQYAGARLSHASFLRRVVEERGGGDVLHVGGRAFVGEELAFLRENRIRTVSDREVRDGDGPARVREFAGSYDEVYLSVDMDVVDPAFCPGVGNPEAAGITSRELLDMVRALSGCRVAGADIVELNPIHDNGAGGSLAAKVLSVLVAMGVAGRGASR